MMSNKMIKILVTTCVGVALWMTPMAFSAVKAQVIAAHEQSPLFQTVAMEVEDEDAEDALSEEEAHTDEDALSEDEAHADEDALSEDEAHAEEDALSEEEAHAEEE